MAEKPCSCLSLPLDARALLCLSCAGAAIDMSVATMRRLVQAGEILSVPVGPKRIRRVPVSALRRYVASLEAAEVAPLPTRRRRAGGG